MNSMGYISSDAVGCEPGIVRDFSPPSDGLALN